MKETSETAVMLSIVVISHNHEAFIATTLDSILMQEVNFTYEVIVCDDASADATAGIINKYAEKHPDCIKPLLSTENIGPCSLAAQGFGLCRGKYLAWLDGDDYWVYKHKLQYQIDFLENNPEYAGCFHDAAINSDAKAAQSQHDTSYYSQWKYFSQFNRYTPDFFPWQLLNRQLIPTASFVCRKNLLNNNIFDSIRNFNLSVNWILQLYIIRSSRFRYINEIWSAYNDHSEGISKKTPRLDFKNNNIAFLKMLRYDPYYAYLRKDLYKALTREYYQLLDINKGHKRKIIKLTLAYFRYELLKIIAELFYFCRKAV